MRKMIYFPCKLVSGEENTIGSKYECEVKPGTKYNFYVLSIESNGTTNLIMDRNICSDGTAATEDNKCLVAWVSKLDYNDDDNYGENGNNNKGPITAMDYLYNATKSWTNTKEMTIDKFDNDAGSKFDMQAYNTYARLPYLSEVSDFDGTNRYLYDYFK